ncbi:hypothetical protein PWT90_07929 [Aphanocladium album]|nr:hypothetical protein PWT90_07929 [Aphanocladium album]
MVQHGVVGGWAAAASYGDAPHLQGRPIGSRVAALEFSTAHLLVCYAMRLRHAVVDARILSCRKQRPSHLVAFQLHGHPGQSRARACLAYAAAVDAHTQSKHCLPSSPPPTKTMLVMVIF